MMKAADLVIVVGGIIGVSIGYYLAKKGADNVPLLDKGNVGEEQFFKNLMKILITLFALAFSLSCSSERIDRPNIVFIFADQMRFSAMGCMKGVAGAAKEPSIVRTPNLDRLAAGGLLFENAFSSTPVCSPYRTSLQTGRYAHDTGTKLESSEITLPQVLKNQGYATGYIGKWHMTPHRARTPTGYVRPEFRPGWDFFAGQENSHNYVNTKIFIGNNEQSVAIKGYEPEFQTDLAIGFIRQNKQRDFLLMLSWGPPHAPYQPPIDRHDIYSPEDVLLRPNVPSENAQEAREIVAGYYGLVSSLDEQIGRIMEELEDLELANNTILCFSSDHGDMLLSHGQTRKRRPWDEAARVPFILRWPARIAAGQKRDFVFGSIHLMPTLLGLCGFSAPDTVRGRDLSAVILGKQDDEPEAAFLEQNELANTPYLAPWRAIRTKEWLYAMSGHIEQGDWLLYDIRKDPYQLHNLVISPNHLQIRENLRSRLLAWRQENDDTLDLRQAYLDRPIQRQSQRQQE